ncbi:PRC-barrel domain-containing protein [Mesorhizobium sp. PAMC28654]|uniref:PRC-barrel domain-containing protein n=1 Tax=Mesorhizobium sp. PAMC28654 TaxID=2880934 RepID=UPI001D0A52C8|nr:PRC-barrel domain-containing protein [Mesorhizobium sp. PAMC28654]UDL90831.1 PRC-barrel domain-containing protein [Mesorhizobium sp. PAMC28654]
MLRHKSEIIGYAIEASDGAIGTVTDVLFDDTNWIVRWLVVDTGKWLSGRKVLLHPSALKHVNYTGHQFAVKLTMQQVKDSPDIDTDQPVTRQMETSIYDHYPWGAPYWTTPYYMGGYGYYVNGFGYMGGPMEEPLADDDIPRRHGDPSLRSVKAVTGYHIHATDGEIGHAEDFLVDDTDWSIHFLVVDTNNWWLGKRVLISPWFATDISWRDRLINVDVTRQTVKDGPAYDASTVVDLAYEKHFQSHYGDGQPILHH